MTNARLSDIAEINPRGPRIGEISGDEMVDFVPMAAVQEDGRMTVAQQRPYAEVAKGFTAFCKEDILLAKITPCYENKKITLAEIKTDFAFGSTEFHVIRCDRDALDSRYLFYFLRQDSVSRVGEKRMTGSAGQRRVPKKFLEELEVPLPSLDEQRRIAAILDQADALRRAHRRALDRLNDLAQSIFYEMFGNFATNPKGWPRRHLEDFILDVTNGMTRRRKGSEKGENIVLRLKDIRPGWIDLSQPNHITLNFKEKQRYKVEEGDMLFVRVNGNPEYVGRCAVFNGFSEKIFFNDHIMRVKLDYVSMRPEFLSFLLNASYGKRQIAQHRKTSAGQHTINQRGLEKIEIPTPPIEMQLGFCECLDNIKHQTSIRECYFIQLDTLFLSLQQRAFRGEL